MVDGVWYLLLFVIWILRCYFRGSLVYSCFVLDAFVWGELDLLVFNCFVPLGYVHVFSLVSGCLNCCVRVFPFWHIVGRLRCHYDLLLGLR